MKEWLLRILIIFTLIVLAVNFVRLLFLPSGDTFELIDIHSVANVLSKFDIPVQALFRDLYDSFVALKKGLDSLFVAVYSLTHSTSIITTLGSIFNLIVAPVNLLVVLGTAIYDFIVFIIRLLYALYQVLSLLFGSSFSFVT